MDLLSIMKETASETRTLNGAKTYDSSGDACLDLFAVAGGMRYRSSKAQRQLFDRAYIENPELAMKLLFYIRDIRGGMGERQTFRTLFRHVAASWPDSAVKNICHIPEYGRYDDLFCLLGTRLETEVVKVVKSQLEADLDAVDRYRKGDAKASVSLLAKWMPSINASSTGTRRMAGRLSRLLGMEPKTYRKTLAVLRANSCVTERFLTAKKTSRIRYHAVPAGAMLKYRSAFKKHDRVRFDSYISKVNKGTETIHAETLFPYEIVRPFMEERHFTLENPDTGRLLEALWNHLPMVNGNANAISVIDTSGSMYLKMHPKALTPALISQSLGLYHAERCKGLFHNHFITFESIPHLLEIHGNTLFDKLRYIQSADWGGSTNLEAVFDLILNTAIKAKARQKDMPSVLYIISDMEFNIAVRDSSRTVYENAKEDFEFHGYDLPAVVFINVNSWQMQAPVRAHTRGTALASGMGVSAFQHKFDGNVTPMSHMLRVLMSKRYERIHA